MENKKIILVTFAYIKTKEDALIGLYATRETYVKKILKYGGIPIFLPPILDKDLIDLYFNQSDGILVPGGSDISPKMYNENKHPETKIKEKERDEVEFYLIQKALKNKKPLLGICRGCQMIGIVSGGKLNQHIPDVSSLNHTVSEEKGYDELFTQEKHEVRIDRSSKVYKILQTEKIKLNTAHHQSLISVGKDFEIVGKTEDGITEIIEHKDSNYFCFGFQSHIEAMEGVTDKIFEEFINVC